MKTLREPKKRVSAQRENERSETHMRINTQRPWNHAELINRILQKYHQQFACDDPGWASTHMSVFKQIFVYLAITPDLKKQRRMVREPV